MEDQYKLLRKSADRIIIALQFEKNPQATDEFSRLLVDFLERQLNRLEFEVANEEASKN